MIPSDHPSTQNDRPDPITRLCDDILHAQERQKRTRVLRARNAFAEDELVAFAALVQDCDGDRNEAVRLLEARRLERKRNPDLDDWRM